MGAILSKSLTMSLKDAMKRDVCILNVPAPLFQAIYHLKIEPLFQLTRIHMYESQCMFNFLLTVHRHYSYHFPTVNLTLPCLAMVRIRKSVLTLSTLGTKMELYSGVNSDG